VLGGSVVDHLASQGSLAYDRDKGQLIAVNAGGDTITVFAVEGDRLIRRQVLPTLGSFPVSVAVHGDVVYVLNARDGGSIQGYRRVGELLAPIRTWHRALGFDPNATPEFLTTPGQVVFTPDGGKLVVTTKSNTSAIDVFNVNAVGGVSLHPIVTSLSDAVPFATTFDSAGNLAVSEAGPNAVATPPRHRRGHADSGVVDRHRAGRHVLDRPGGRHPVRVERWQRHAVGGPRRPE